jgi:hypothetical protein
MMKQKHVISTLVKKIIEWALLRHSIFPVETQVEQYSFLEHRKELPLGTDNRIHLEHQQKRFYWNP